jgi:hypothetical protein
MDTEQSTKRYLAEHVDPVLWPLIQNLAKTKPIGAAEVRKQLTRLIAEQETLALARWPRLALADCDGTLLRTNHGVPISAYTLEALQAYRKAGGIFCIITGRPWKMAGRIINELPGAIDYAFCSDGNICCDVRQGMANAKISEECSSILDLELCWGMAKKLLATNPECSVIMDIFEEKIGTVSGTNASENFCDFMYTAMTSHGVSKEEVS